MGHVSSTVRITVGLVCLVVSLVLAAQTVGLMPDRRRAVLEGRLALCESLAISWSTLVGERDQERLVAALRATVERNPDIQSAAIRRSGGQLIVEIGDHASFWNVAADQQSTASQIYVPLISGAQQWGTVEVRFRPLDAGGVQAWLDRPIFKLLLFMASTSMAVFFLYLRQMLQHLDPSKVVPDRVRAALDTLASGLVVLDKDDRIVLTHVATPWLDGKHSVFGRVIDGQDVVDAVAQGDVMEKVEVSEEP